MLCNGIGAGLEVLDPLVDRLARTSRSSASTCPEPAVRQTLPCPTGFPISHACSDGYLRNFGIDRVDILGLSWGGALAQQFAFQNPRRCRRLVLASTATGALMVPAHPRVLLKMATPRRFGDPEYAADIAAENLRRDGSHRSRTGCRPVLPADGRWLAGADTRINSRPERCGRACRRCGRSDSRRSSSLAPMIRSSRSSTPKSCTTCYRIRRYTCTRVATSTSSPMPPRLPR